MSKVKKPNVFQGNSKPTMGTMRTYHNDSDDEDEHQPQEDQHSYYDPQNDRRQYDEEITKMFGPSSQNIKTVKKNYQLKKKHKQKKK